MSKLWRSVAKIMICSTNMLRVGIWPPCTRSWEGTTKQLNLMNSGLRSVANPRSETTKHMLSEHSASSIEVSPNTKKHSITTTNHLKYSARSSRQEMRPTLSSQL